MNSDILISLVALLKKSLEFYGNPDNYKNDLINKDAGFIAKSAIEQATVIENRINSYEKFYEEMQEAIDSNNKPEDIVKAIQELAERINKS